MCTHITVKSRASQGGTEAARSGPSHPVDLGGEGDETFGNQPDVVAQALGNYVEVPASGHRLLADLLSESLLDGGQAIVDGRDTFTENDHAAVKGDHAIFETRYAVVEGNHAVVEGNHVVVDRSNIRTKSIKGIPGIGIHGGYCRATILPSSPATECERTRSTVRGNRSYCTAVLLGPFWNLQRDNLPRSA
ncbi:MAG: hypothetical protein EHM55_22040 [Acidobacteria bacterium]|nr:MAG: hypothetical protein EHM55_22040 [Acidobacteriota bacterium]